MLKRVFVFATCFVILCQAVRAEEVIDTGGDSSTSEPVSTGSVSVIDPEPVDPSPAETDTGGDSGETGEASDQGVASDNPMVDPSATEGEAGEVPSSGDAGSSPIYILAEPETEVVYVGDDIPVDATITDIAIMSLAPVTSDSTSGLKAALLGVLGDYDPVIVEYEYQNPNNNYSSYLREVQPDYVWIASAALLALVIWCLFRLGGALLRG